MAQQIALVTGGTGGIGTAICQQLSGQGYRVVAGYLPGDAESAKAWQERLLADEYQVEIVAGDVACFDSSRSMVRGIESRIGAVDILVNCAGITKDKTLCKMEHDQWQAVIDTNLSSVFNVTRQVIEGMSSRGFGRIINISSVNGQRGQFGQTNYSAAKAGMHGFTMALAQEVARNGITVNTVSPGFIQTEMTMAVPEQIRNEIVQRIPCGDMGQPQQIAHVVGFLCSVETSYITGANIPVNGGMYMSF